MVAHLRSIEHAFGTSSKPSRRASLDDITFTEPEPAPAVPISYLRPASAFARPVQFRKPLSNITESTKSSSGVSNNFQPGLKADTADRCHSRQESALNIKPPAAESAKIPNSSVPKRRSSKNRSREVEAARGNDDLPQWSMQIPPPKGSGQTVSTRGPSKSPVRLMTESHLPSSHDRRIPSRTFIRAIKPIDVLEIPELKHSRVSVDPKVSAPLFMGGATIEGEVCITVDGGKPKRRQQTMPVLSIGRISVDVLGVETFYEKQHVFRSLAIELIDDDHPPPSVMIAASQPLNDGFWEISPTTSLIPFRLNLPVNMGPPPFKAKHASIKYILCATVTLKILGNQIHVRKSKEIAILTASDPEKALVNLTTPLTSTDHLIVPKSSLTDSVTLTAGIHRQIWISGMSLFVDVQVSNSTSKTVKRLDLEIVRTMMTYNYSSSTRVPSISDLMTLPQQNERKVVARRSIQRNRHAWQGVIPLSRDERTWKMDIPSGLATISPGRFFSVRYFLYIRIQFSLLGSQSLAIQIPITIIHPNSLDILPNSLAQVATSIEHAYNHAHQGENAPKDQSMNASRPYKEGHRTPRESQDRNTDMTGSTRRYRQCDKRSEEYKLGETNRNEQRNNSFTSEVSTGPQNLEASSTDEESRAYVYRPGAAFSAARRQSTEHMRRSLDSTRASNDTEQSNLHRRTSERQGQRPPMQKRRVSFGDHEKKPILSTPPLPLPKKKGFIYSGHNRSRLGYRSEGAGLRDEDITTLTKELEKSPRKFSPKKSIQSWLPIRGAETSSVANPNAKAASKDAIQEDRRTNYTNGPRSKPGPDRAGYEDLLQDIQRIAPNQLRKDFTLDFPDLANSSDDESIEWEDDLVEDDFEATHHQSSSSNGDSSILNFTAPGTYPPSPTRSSPKMKMPVTINAETVVVRRRPPPPPPPVQYPLVRRPSVRSPPPAIIPQPLNIRHDRLPKVDHDSSDASLEEKLLLARRTRERLESRRVGGERHGDNRRAASEREREYTGYTRSKKHDGEARHFGHDCQSEKKEKRKKGDEYPKRVILSGGGGGLQGSYGNGRV